MAHSLALPDKYFFKADQAITIDILTKSLLKKKDNFSKSMLFNGWVWNSLQKDSWIDLNLQKAPSTWSSQKSLFWKIILCTTVVSFENTKKKQVYKRYIGWLWSW